MTRRLWLGAVWPGLVFPAPLDSRRDSARRMADDAANFLASLKPDQRARASFDFSDEERFNWHFVPRARKGLPFADMTPAQRDMANALLAVGLSRAGLNKANTIMSLENVLRVIENDSGDRRNPEKYYFSVFGPPSADARWGYRIEGHHISLNFTVARDRIAAGPSFFGANPAEIRQGERKGLRALAAEEDRGRELVTALDSGQRETAIVSPKAYPDILTSASRRASLEGQPAGLAASSMTTGQRDLLTALVSEYAGNFAEPIAAERMVKLKAAGANLHFAWAGGIHRGDPHYYRVQAPDFLIEYDDTQNGANHIHSVWRDLGNGDWGLDLLALHYGPFRPHRHG